MMNKQILALLIIISLAGAAIYYLSTKPSQSFDPTELLFSDLLQKADRIEKVEILNHHGNLLSATRGKDGWFTRIESIGIDYPVDQEKLSALVSNLAEAKIFEAKTSKLENYPSLGVSDIQLADSQASLINVFAAGKQFSLLVGKQSGSGQGSYVRRANENQSWLVDIKISLPSSEFEWLKQPITNIDKKSVNSISRRDEQDFTFTKQDAEGVGFELLGLNRRESLKYESIIDAFVDNIINLGFLEIINMPENFWQPSASEPDKVLIPFSLTLVNGERISMTSATSNDQHFIRFVRNSTSGQNYWDGVTYLISSYSSGQINKRRDDFIETNENLNIVEPPQAIDEGESPN